MNFIKVYCGWCSEKGSRREMKKYSNLGFFHTKAQKTQITSCFNKIEQARWLRE